MAEAIRRIRMGEVNPVPGYDGEYGRIEVIDQGNYRSFAGPGLSLWQPAHAIPYYATILHAARYYSRGKTGRAAKHAGRRSI